MDMREIKEPFQGYVDRTYHTESERMPAGNEPLTHKLRNDR